jgi:hypothetical protein
VTDINYLYLSVSLSPSAQSVPSSPSHYLLLTFRSASLPFQIISPSVPSNALYIQHF